MTANQLRRRIARLQRLLADVDPRQTDWLLQRQRDDPENKIPTLDEVVSMLLDDGSIAENAYIYREDYDEDEYDEDEIEEMALEDARASAEEELEREYDNIVDILDQEDFDIWRAVTLPEDVDPEDLEFIGIYWADNVHSAKAHWGKSGQATWVYHARADAENVDYLNTVLARCTPSTGPEEDEINLLEQAPIFVYDVRHKDDPYGHDAIEINAWRRT